MNYGPAVIVILAGTFMLVWLLVIAFMVRAWVLELERARED